MSKTKKLFRELKREIFKVVLLKSVLNTAIFFLVIGILFALVSIPIKDAFPVAGIYFIANFIFIYRKVNLLVLEDKNSILKDILSTAADNIDQKSFMMSALTDDLISRIKKVSSGTMINPKHMFIKIFIIAVLCFGIIFVSSLNITFANLNDDLEGLMNLIPENSNNIFMELPNQTLNFSSDIYGVPKVAKLGNRKLDLNLATSLADIDITKRKEAEYRRFMNGEFITDVGAVQDTPSQERLPKEASLALAYNKKLKEFD